MNYREFVFEEKVIRGFLHLGYKDEVIIISHGFSGNKTDHHFMFSAFAKTLTSLGYYVLRFDYLGSGDSDGTFEEDIRIHKQIKQLHAIVDELIHEFKAVHLFGFSLGGVISSKVASTRCDISSLFLLSPAGNFDEIVEKLLIGKSKIGNVYDYIGFKVHEDVVEEAKAFDYYKGLNCFRNSVQIVFGSSDQFVRMESIQAYKDTFSQVGVCIVDGADHCYSTIDYSEQVKIELKKFYGGMHDESQNMANERHKE